MSLEDALEVEAEGFAELATTTAASSQKACPRISTPPPARRAALCWTRIPEAEADVTRLNQPEGGFVFGAQSRPAETNSGMSSRSAIRFVSVMNLHCIRSLAASRAFLEIR